MVYMTAVCRHSLGGTVKNETDLSQDSW